MEQLGINEGSASRELLLTIAVQRSVWQRMQRALLYSPPCFPRKIPPAAYVSRVVCEQTRRLLVEAEHVGDPLEALVSRKAVLVKVSRGR